MAGAGTAFLGDAAATLRNPASGTFLESGSTWDLAIGLPTAGYSATETSSESAYSLFEYDAGNYRSVYKPGFAPSIARVWRVSDRWAWAVGVYGAGLGTTLTEGSAAIARGIPGAESRCSGDFAGGFPLSGGNVGDRCGAQRADAGIQLTQIVANLSVSYRPAEWLAIGFAPLLGVQELKLRGLSAFSPYSVDSANVSDRGQDYSWGFGYRVGLHLRPKDWFEFGVSYQPRMRQTEFDRYRGALVGASLDIPGNFNVGIHLRLTDRQSVMLDWDQVRFDQIRPYAASPDMSEFVNQCVLPRFVAGGALAREDSEYCLAGSKGPGFGWGAMTVVKLGYQVHFDRVVWRAGYSRGGSPIKEHNAIMTVLAPAVGGQHIATGLSWDHSSRLNIGLAVSYAIRARRRVTNGLSNIELRGGSPGDLLAGALVQVDAGPDSRDQVVEVHMDTWQLQIGFTWRLQDFH